MTGHEERTTESWALEMARRGFRVFPLKPGSKEPFITGKCSAKHRRLAGGLHKATTDAAEIKRWFETEPTINYGVATAELVVLDVDSADDKPGFETLRSHIGKLPATFVVRTPRKGLHAYFKGPGTRQRRFGPGIDVRSIGGYVAGVGSVFEGKPYSVLFDVALAELPTAIRETLAREKSKAANTTPSAELDLPGSHGLAVAHVKAAPGAAKGSRGTTAYQLAAQLKDLGISEEVAREVLDDYWAPRCDPPADPDVYHPEIARAYQYGRNLPGCNNPLTEFEPVPAELMQPAAADGVFEFDRDITLESILHRQQDALLKGQLYRGDTALIYGASTAGKSFVALDLCYAIAHGRAWHGIRVKQAPCLYVTWEGVAGFRKRVYTHKATHGSAGNRFVRFKPHVTLSKSSVGHDGAQQVIGATGELAKLNGEPVGLIVIDTLARSISGDDENAAADMMHFLEKRAGAIARATGAAVLIIHHENVEGRARGSSSLIPACDLVWRLERSGSGTRRTLVGEKVKDGAEGPLFAFDLETVTLGMDDDGDVATSCIVRAAEAVPLAKRTGKPPKREPKPVRTLRDAIYAAIVAGKATELEDAQSGETVKAVPLAAVQSEFFGRYVTGEADEKTAKATKARKWRGALSNLPADINCEVVSGAEMIWERGGQSGQNGSCPPESALSG